MAENSPGSAGKVPGLYDAFVAVKRLIADKEDTSQVFTILEALGKRSSEKSWKKFKKHPNYSMLREQPPLMNFLCDKKWLSSLPEGSLGRHYYEFLQRENISAEGLVEASEKGFSGLRPLADETVEFHQRQRDAHDLWHVLTGYGRDALGELCLLAVTYRLLGNPGLLLIILFGGRHIKKLNPGFKFWSAIGEGFRHGRQMSWLPGVDWKDVLPLPIDEARSMLNIQTPAIYQDVVESTLKQGGIHFDEQLSAAE